MRPSLSQTAVFQAASIYLGMDNMGNSDASDFLLSFLPPVCDVPFRFHHHLRHDFCRSALEGICHRFSYLFPESLRTLHDKLIVHHGEQLRLELRQDVPQVRLVVLVEPTAHSALDDGCVAALNAMVLPAPSDGTPQAFHR